jgi:hypothetical protein
MDWNATRPTVAALHLVHAANEMVGPDPRMPVVTLLTAAWIAGHILEVPPEKMHTMLDQVQDAAMAMMLEATETKQ